MVEGGEMLEYSKIRKKTFSGNYSVDQELVQTVQHEPGHKFLYMPASHLVCRYLTAYICNIAVYHFKKDIDKIRILDWGCGKGWVSYLLKKAGADVTCCDVQVDKDDSAFGQATPIIEKYGYEVIPLHHEYKMPFPDTSFDIILSVGVLEHVPNEKQSLLEINRVLADRGLLLCFNLPYHFSWVQRALHLRGNYYHDRLYTKRGAGKLLDDAHFKIQDIWHRQLYPRSMVPFSWYYLLERVDQILVERTPLKYFTNYIEFIAEKTDEKKADARAAG